MSRWLRLEYLFVPIFALACLPDATAADDLKGDVEAGKKLLSEGDSLADAGDTTEAVLRYKKAFEQLLPGLRKLPFKREVKRDVTAREDLRAMLIKEIDEERKPAEFRGDELGMKALGLIPMDLNLKETMVGLYAEEIAAFYDPKTETMHLIKEPVEKLKKQPTFLERLMGKKGGFDKDENKTVIAHELTHALADQHYNIDAIQAQTRGDDDRQLAFSLVEGEATLSMMGAQMKDWQGTQIIKLPSADLERTLSLLTPLMARSGGPRLREAPPILSESMIFPYMRGLVFCARLTNDGGWSAVDDAYRRPPLSTEQVLHPDKYRANPDAPMAIDLGKLEAGPEWKEAGRNVVGEMQLGVLLSKHGGKAAAAGWDGDSFAVFEGPKQRLGLVWATTWDTEDDAREFGKAYARFQTTKLGPAVTEPDAFPDAIRRPSDGGVFAVERRGADVCIVEGFPSEATETLVEAAFRSAKTEKTHAESPRPKTTEKQADAAKTPG